MFGTLFFLLLFLVLVSLVPETESAQWIANPWEALAVGAGLYVLLLVGLRALGKSRRWPRYRKERMAHGALLVFFLLFYFGLGGDRPFAEWGPFGWSQAIASLLPLALYFTGLWCFYRRASALAFLLPFVLPFVVLLLVFDSVAWFPPLEPWWPYLFLAVLALLFVGMPWLTVRSWGSEPLGDTPLHRRLEAVCQACGFRHGGMARWTALQGVATAAIVGVAPRLRYILFTNTLLATFPPEQVEAILVHEIGHNVRRHLLFYPLIVAGMVVLGALGAEWLAPWYEHTEEWLARSAGENLGPFLLSIGVFAGYAVLFGVYFRLVYGFFSRLFERQADLHIFATPLDPQNMIDALDHLGVVTGHSHDQPSWHHGSIRSRMTFLQQAVANPEVIEAFHRRVRGYLWGYIVLLVIGLIVVFVR